MDNKYICDFNTFINESSYNRLAFKYVNTYYKDEKR